MEKVGKQEIFMKSRNFHEIPGFRGNSVKSHDAAGGEKRKRGGPPGAPRGSRNRTNNFNGHVKFLSVSRGILNSERFSRFQHPIEFSASQNRDSSEDEGVFCDFGGPAWKGGPPQRGPKRGPPRGPRMQETAENANSMEFMEFN